MDMSMFLMYTMVVIMSLVMLMILIILAYFAIGALKLTRSITNAVKPLAPLVSTDRYARTLVKPADKLTKTEVQKLREILEVNE
jgi:uncharacterized membrane protein